MKRKQIEIMLALLAVLLYNGVPVEGAALFFNDGQNHVFSAATWDMVDIAGSGTHAQVVDGAALQFLGVSAYATAQIDGGIIGQLAAFGQSQIVINGGTITFVGSPGAGINAWDSATIEVRGGTFDTLVTQFDNHASGIGGGGTIYLYGDEFSVDGHPLQYGQSLRDYAAISGPNLTGTVTGRLLDGSLFNVPFTIIEGANGPGGDIIVVPEPCTIALLGLGLPLLRILTNRK
jgi:hypothetical protein